MHSHNHKRRRGCRCHQLVISPRATRVRPRRSWRGSGSRSGSQGRYSSVPPRQEGRGHRGHAEGQDQGNEYRVRHDEPCVRPCCARDAWRSASPGGDGGRRRPASPRTSAWTGGRSGRHQSVAYPVTSFSRNSRRSSRRSASASWWRMTSSRYSVEDRWQIGLHGAKRCRPQYWRGQVTMFSAPSPEPQRRAGRAELPRCDFRSVGSISIIPRHTGEWI